MTHRAPMHVPVEILRRDGRTRWFRLTTHVSSDSLRFAHLIPDDLDGPLALAFHLPGDPVPLRAAGRAVDEVVGEGEDEHAERYGIAFVDLDEASRARITNYVHERLGLS
jgi:PilZ domain-containing protein